MKPERNEEIFLVNDRLSAIDYHLSKNKHIGDWFCYTTVEEEGEENEGDRSI